MKYNFVEINVLTMQMILLGKLEKGYQMKNLSYIPLKEI